MTLAGPHPAWTAGAQLVAFLSQALLFGLLPVLLWVVRPAFVGLQGPVVEATAARLARLVRTALLLAACAAVGDLVLQSALVAEVRGTGLRPMAVVEALQAGVGQGDVLRLSLVGALAVLLPARVRGAVLGGPGDEPAAWWWAWGVLGLALLATVSWTGHARSAAQPVLAIPVDLVHLAAGAVWLTGVVLLVAVLIGLQGRGSDLDRQQALSGLVLAFSRVALVALPVVAVTGTITAVMAVDSVADLRLTDFGRVLLLKLWLVLWVFGLGGYHHLRVRRRLAVRSGATAVRTREAFAVTVTGELVFGVLVMAATAVLVGVPRP